MNTRNYTAIHGKLQRKRENYEEWAAHWRQHGPGWRDQLLFHTLRKYCSDMGLSCKVVFWVLKLKGIDDYFACNRRNIDYSVK